ncbi:MAG: NAD(P)H-dependent oxidoreductase [Wenzhouxiangellaceae bacterium]|nr:NAD(P)H-dependent oxidoreductase [Wenzhouxiangellaceae bacterium]
MPLHVLAVRASLFGDDGQSSRLVAHFLDRLEQQQPDLHLQQRMLTPESMPHLDAATFKAFGSDAEARGELQRERVERSDTLIAELRESDLLVLGLPMYNFAVPSTVKAWFDHLARAGVTFRYTENGPEGLLTRPRTLIIATRGGRYAGTPADTQTPWVETFLNFIGIRKIDWVYAEGLATAAAEDSLADAQRALDEQARSFDP